MSVLQRLAGRIDTALRADSDVQRGALLGIGFGLLLLAVVMLIGLFLSIISRLA